ncbi:14589_t:CDS:2 [Entrophospora sp. SA101]|nr:14589_t:CDS:2 [Entrophospora sp. SA101]
MSWRNQLSKSLKELRIHFCQTSPSSKGVREFITNNYLSLKEANPKFPILIREASGIEARFFARYDFGEEKKIALNNLSARDVESKLEELVRNKHYFLLWYLKLNQQLNHKDPITSTKINIKIIPTNNLSSPASPIE